MLRKTDLFRPLPKTQHARVSSQNVGCFFDYEKYTDQKIICANLLKIPDDMLFEELSIFAKNHYKYRDVLYYNLQTVTKADIGDKDLDGYYELENTKKHF